MSNTYYEKPKKGSIWTTPVFQPTVRGRPTPSPTPRLSTVLGIKLACRDEWWIQLYNPDGTFVDVPQWQWYQWREKGWAKLEAE